METIKFDKKLKCGPDYVAIRILDNADDMKIGQIYVAQGVASNSRLAFAVVEDSGSAAKKTRGIETGDYVMVDRLSTFGHTHPVAALRYDNVIAKTDADRTALHPLLGMVMVEDCEVDSKVGQIYVPGYSDKLKTGKTVEANLTLECDIPIQAGSKVVLTKSSDLVEFGGKKYRFYREEDVVATIASDGEGE